MNGSKKKEDNWKVCKSKGECINPPAPIGWRRIAVICCCFCCCEAFDTPPIRRRFGVWRRVVLDTGLLLLEETRWWVIRVPPRELEAIKFVVFVEVNQTDESPSEWSISQSVSSVFELEMNHRPPASKRQTTTTKEEEEEGSCSNKWGKLVFQFRRCD